jgi:NAD(P)-dependent dehydrogenase (short-subunit alcohol dehydrogenase family)
MTMTPAILVTGASSGLGLETALHLAASGFQVFATMRDLARRGPLDEEARRRRVEIEALQLDVTDRASIDRALVVVAERCGTLYGLVNNAGVQVRGYFEDVADDEVRDLFETNVFGTMAVTRAVLPQMREAGRGRIVIVSSIGGRIGAPGSSVYCASKFALEGFGESLALEAKLVGVSVSVIAPAVVKTDIWSRNRGVARGAYSSESPYRDRFSGLERLTDGMVARASTTATEVARAVEAALTAKEPRMRRVVGRRAALMLAARKRLPGAMFDRLYLRALNHFSSPGPGHSEATGA